MIDVDKESLALAERGIEALRVVQLALADKDFNTVEVYVAALSLAYSIEKQIPAMAELSKYLKRGLDQLDQKKEEMN